VRRGLTRTLVRPRPRTIDVWLKDDRGKRAEAGGGEGSAREENGGGGGGGCEENYRTRYE